MQSKVIAALVAFTAKHLARFQEAQDNSPVPRERDMFVVMFERADALQTQFVELSDELTETLAAVFPTGQCKAVADDVRLEFEFPDLRELGTYAVKRVAPDPHVTTVGKLAIAGLVTDVLWKMYINPRTIAA